MGLSQELTIAPSQHGQRGQQFFRTLGREFREGFVHMQCFTRHKLSPASERHQNPVRNLRALSTSSGPAESREEILLWAARAYDPSTWEVGN